MLYALDFGRQERQGNIEEQRVNGGDRQPSTEVEYGHNSCLLVWREQQWSLHSGCRSDHRRFNGSKLGGQSCDDLTNRVTAGTVSDGSLWGNIVEILRGSEQSEGGAEPLLGKNQAAMKKELKSRFKAINAMFTRGECQVSRCIHLQR